MTPKSEDERKTGNKRTKTGRFVKGGKGGPGRKPGVKVRVKRAYDFMESKGWKELEYYALNRSNPKVAVDALKTLAAYGHGRPVELVEFSSDDEAGTIADFFSRKNKAKDQKPPKP